MKANIWAFLLAVCCFLPFVARANETVMIGDQTISVPVPDGFGRLDGVNAKADAVLGKFVAATHRSLLTLATKEDVEQMREGHLRDLPRCFSLQTLRAAEGENVTLRDFKEIEAGFEKEYVVADGFSKATDTVNETLQRANLSVNMKIGEMKSLGIFDKTDRSLDFGAMTKLQVGTGAPRAMIVAGSIAIIRGKLAYLLVYASYQDDQDIAWARGAVKSWRESIQAANPGGTAKGGPFDFSRVGNGAITGAIAGTIGAVVGLGFRRKKSKAV